MPKLEFWHIAASKSVHPSRRHTSPANRNNTNNDNNNNHKHDPDHNNTNGNGNGSSSSSDSNSKCSSSNRNTINYGSVAAPEERESFQSYFRSQEDERRKGSCRLERSCAMYGSRTKKGCSICATSIHVRFCRAAMLKEMSLRLRKCKDLT